ncbi:MAG: DEAD/DEAH box helicase family protein [Candidatus Anaerobiospirillum pullicola]|uniref:DEAD/DEAH box helicase family protein n=1 Tax=Candidatus Anaerobiospirillum pullicola TaxID=2838451 RepID=A0A948TGH7_9GAMM|nr:DEAD/DEAH box helicase family protein [Candidatus Anaerobiospirillum pullicola]
MSGINPHPSEEDVKTKIVIPALLQAGWSHENFLTEYNLRSDKYQIVPQTGQVEQIAQKQQRPDIILCTNIFHPLAVIEVKRSELDSAGIDQAIKYAKTLQVPLAYATAGHGFVEYNLKTGQQRSLSLTDFPSLNELWSSYCTALGITAAADQQNLAKAQYFRDEGTVHGRLIPRYYQMVAINSVVQAIVGLHRRRLLLVMATGTGKTYTAMQIVFRLKQAGVIHRVLYLADRNKLVDQAMSAGFESIAPCLKITGGKIDTHHEIYFGLYQQLSTSRKAVSADVDSEDAEAQVTSLIDLYRKLPPDFFDLVIVDECHRGSAAEESSWREILEYFHPAIQLGLTATPNTKDGADNTAYFGEPVFTYSLKKGIEEGFLAPYRVIRIDLDKDKTGWMPELGQLDDNGQEIPPKLYTVSDFDRTIVLPDRIKRVAQIINDFQHNSLGDMAKTIVFCATQNHALRMRDALRELNPQHMQENSNYIVRMTSNDEEGKALYAQFCSISEEYPVIVTTSKLLTTGADTKGTQLIVIDANIKSHTEFKQIIGRGTRLAPENGKTSFTILDFRRVSEIFNDPDFDGEPDELQEVGDPASDDPIFKPKAKAATTDKQGSTKAAITNRDANDHDAAKSNQPHGTESRKRSEHVVSGVEFTVVDANVLYLDETGKRMSTPLRDFAKQRILSEFPASEDFTHSWLTAKSKADIIAEMERQGVFFSDLRQVLGQDNLDEFDIVNHIGFNKELMTRSERAEQARHSAIMQRYDARQQQLLRELIAVYEDQGFEAIEKPVVLKAPRFQAYGGVPQIIASIGGADGKDGYRQALSLLLYQDGDTAEQAAHADAAGTSDYTAVP